MRSVSRRDLCRGAILAGAGIATLRVFPVRAGEEAVGLKSALSTSVPTFEMPDWVDRQIGEAYARYKSWRGGAEGVVFPLVADLHATHPLFLNPPDFLDKKYHVLFAQRAALTFKADFFAELGDIGFDRDLSWKPSKKEEAQKRLETQRNLYKDFPLPVLFCMGNHDSGRAYGEVFSEWKLSAKDYGGMFNGMIKARGVKLETSPDEDYGYYDVPAKKTRVFFLNTSDSFEAGYSPEQLQFLAEHLRMPEGTCAVILQHICLHPAIGRWRSAETGKSSPGTIRNADICLELLSGFVQGAKGEMKNVRWDFTGTRGTTLAGCFSGHSHFNDQSVYRGVNFIITQSYGTVSAKNLPEKVDYVTPVDLRETMLVDMVAIKPATREMKIFRIGAGGSERDRRFTF